MIKLEELCSKISVGHVGKTSEFYTDNKGVPFLRTQNVTSSGLDLTGLMYVTHEFHSQLKKSELHSGDVVISRVVSTKINCAIIPEDLKIANCANIIVVSPKRETLDSRYLMYYLKSVSVQRDLLKRQVGSAQSVVNTSVIKDWLVPHPPLMVQQRIAGILDKADAISQKRQQAITLADDFLRSVFLDIFGNPITNSKGWDEVTLKEIADIRSGVTKGKQVKESDSITLPYMRVANVQDGYLDLSSIQKITVSKRDAEKCKLEKGDILLTEGGDPDKLGRGHVWNGEIENCIHQNHIFSVRIIDREYIRPEFLSAVISSLRGKQYFLKMGKQTTGIATINKTVLSNFMPFVPPVDIQDKYLNIVRKVKGLPMYNEYDYTNLFHSLSQKAFSGQLKE
ncbi:restriction endonuclease subunit S [Aeromonas rivipollensis]|uniref:restriction endonuclease subunit S n=1 Tax=Aeromonas rivipollensis TaxID=948519 RepID=UPI0039864A21